MLEKYFHKHHISRFMHNNYNELVMSNTFRSFGISLISLFLPIFLMQMGFSFMEVLIFEIILLLFLIIGHYYVVKYSQKGVKKMMVVSYLLSIIFYMLLYNSEKLILYIGKIPFLVFIGIFNVLSLSLFWMSFHLYFIKSTKKDQGKKYGLLLALPVFLSIVSPFVGSLLIDGYGFQLSFLVTTICLLIGGVILFFSKEIKTSSKYDIDKTIKGEGKTINTMYVLEGCNVVATGFMWPILLFFLGIKIVSMGLLYLISNIIYATASYMSGKMSDTKGPEKFISFGSIGMGFSLIFRALTKTIVMMSVFQSLGGLFGAILFVPFRSKFYKISHKDSVNHILNRELYMHIGRIIGLGFILVLSVFLRPVIALVIALIISGIMTFGFSFLIKEKDVASSTQLSSLNK